MGAFRTELVGAVVLSREVCVACPRTRNMAIASYSYEYVRIVSMIYM